MALLRRLQEFELHSLCLVVALGSLSLLALEHRLLLIN